MANELGNRVLQLDLPSYPKPEQEEYEEWMDQPILFVTRGTASQAGQEQKTEEIKDTRKKATQVSLGPKTDSNSDRSKP